MFGLGTTELLIIGVIVLVLFGAKKLPDIGKGLGEAIREFRGVKKDVSDEKTVEEEEKGNRRGDNSMEKKLLDKASRDIPVIRKGMEAKDKLEKIRKIME